MIKIEWPDGSAHVYDTDHAGVNRLANFLTQMYVMGELELVETIPAPIAENTYTERYGVPASRSEGAGELQYATGGIITPNDSEDIMDRGERVDLSPDQKGLMYDVDA